MLESLRQVQRLLEDAMEYGQFCPIAKASELIGEKWTVLIIREILMGGRRFVELQRGLGTISPTVLTRRLADLEANGLVYKKTPSGSRGHEYWPTESCKELLPVLLALGNWGMRWAHENLRAEDYDAELLMLYLQRSVLPDKLPDTQTIIQFRFEDTPTKPDWWLLCDGADVEVCDKDPGKDVDVCIRTTVKTMTEIWMGKRTFRAAKKSRDIAVTGNRYLATHLTSWIQSSPFEAIPSADNIL